MPPTYAGYRVRVQALASIPSPTHSVWHLGPAPDPGVRAVHHRRHRRRVWLTDRRWRERGGNPDHVWDVAAWAIVLRHRRRPALPRRHRPGAVLRRRQAPDRRVQDLGRRARHLGRDRARRARAPGSAAGAATSRSSCSPTPPCPASSSPRRIGRWGNWFNNELYGGPTSLPWGLQIHDLDVGSGHAARRARSATSARTVLRLLTSRPSCTSRCGTSRSASR